MNQQLCLRGERGLLAGLSLFSLCAIGGALFVQFYQHADPCPLCILQRYAYLLLAFFALLGATTRGQAILRIAQSLILVTAISGIAIASRQLFLLAHPSFSCGFDALQPILDQLPPAKSLPFIFKVAGLCDTPGAPVMGLSLPVWSLLGYLFIVALVSYSLWQRQRT